LAQPLRAVWCEAKKKRNSYGPEFKAKVGLEAVRGVKTVNEIAQGQEMDNATAALAKMNMILHDCPTAEIWKDNTLSSPHFKQAGDKS
jgi:type I restriction-modification system DNA methylase subunit